jgi:hypothetical protein
VAAYWSRTSPLHLQWSVVSLPYECVGISILLHFLQLGY